VGSSNPASTGAEVPELSDESAKIASEARAAIERLFELSELRAAGTATTDAAELAERRRRAVEAKARRKLLAVGEKAKRMRAVAGEIRDEAALRVRAAEASAEDARERAEAAERRAEAAERRAETIESRARRTEGRRFNGNGNGSGHAVDAELQALARPEGIDKIEKRLRRLGYDIGRQGEQSGT
jgi:type IV secretory pathway VirJ component